MNKLQIRSIDEGDKRPGATTYIISLVCNREPIDKCRLAITISEVTGKVIYVGSGTKCNEHMDYCRARSYGTNLTESLMDVPHIKNLLGYYVGITRTEKVFSDLLNHGCVVPSLKDKAEDLLQLNQHLETL